MLFLPVQQPGFCESTAILSIADTYMGCFLEWRPQAADLFSVSEQRFAKPLPPEILRTADKKGNTMQQFQWQDRFNIGVEIIDQAHRRLFSIVQKMMDLYVEKHENRFACVEGIKYFKAYTLKHFAEEEAYMRMIGYSGYTAHKKIHDKMKYETLPELERLLYESDFSVEMVQRFIGICTGWLTGHIIIEDRAILGVKPAALAPMRLDDEVSVIQTVIIAPLQEILGYQIQFVGQFSTRDVILNEECYELVYSTQEGKRLRVILVMGQQTLLRAAGLLFGIDFYEKNDIVCFAMQEIAQNLIQRAEVDFGGRPDEFRLERGRFLERETFVGMFRERPPQYSLLFHVEQESFALCIDQDPESDPPVS